MKIIRKSKNARNEKQIPKIWQISKNLDMSFLSSINLSFQKSVTWEIKKELKMFSSRRICESMTSELSQIILYFVEIMVI